MTDTSTLLLANLKRRYDRMVRTYATMITTLQVAEAALQACSMEGDTEAAKQSRLIALDMLANTLRQAATVQQANGFAEVISARMEGQGPGPRQPFSPARGVLGCLVVACMIGASAALMFGGVQYLIEDPWRVLWAMIAVGAASTLAAVLLYRNSHRGES